MRVAILSSLNTRASEVLASLLSHRPLKDDAGARAFRRQLAVCVGAAKDPDVLRTIFEALGAASKEADRPALLSVVAGMGDGLKRARLSLRNAASQAGPKASALVEEFLSDSAKVAADDAKAEDVRLEAIELVVGTLFGDDPT